MANCRETLSEQLCCDRNLCIHFDQCCFSFKCDCFHCLDVDINIFDALIIQEVIDFGYFGFYAGISDAWISYCKLRSG